MKISYPIIPTQKIQEALRPPSDCHIEKYNPTLLSDNAPFPLLPTQAKYRPEVKVALRPEYKQLGCGVPSEHRKSIAFIMLETYKKN